LSKGTQKSQREEATTKDQKTSKANTGTQLVATQVDRSATSRERRLGRLKKNHRGVLLFPLNADTI